MLSTKEIDEKSDSNGIIDKQKFPIHALAVIYKSMRISNRCEATSIIYVLYFHQKKKTKKSYFNDTSSDYCCLVTLDNYLYIRLQNFLSDSDN